MTFSLATVFAGQPNEGSETEVATAQRSVFKVRASLVDPKAKEHPEIDFVFEKNGQPQDIQYASVDTRVTPQGRLVIWLMGYNPALFERINGYGIHAIQVHYANKWFGLLCQPRPKSSVARGNIRLEAAIGEDVSDELAIPKPDSMVERSRQFLIWLAAEHPEGDWNQFLTDDQSEIRWDKVTIAGSSHGSTTAARFAQYQKVGRVVMLCGPRDQDQDWQALASATPSNRFFGFSHVLDGGWAGNHYCRSWELLGLNQHGPIVNVDESKPPYDNSRRLISAANVSNDARRAHSAVAPGSASPKDQEGRFVYEPVWDYLFNHAIESTGSPVERESSCTVQP